ncbi:MAG: TonB-dependent receptor [Chitinophagaceae bacterium]
MRYIYLLFLLQSIAMTSLAQNKGSIKGIVYDTLAKQPVPSATITVLKKKDSSLVTFTMTDSKGYFEVTGLPDGDLRLLITHINYHNTSKVFTIDDAHKTIDAGNVAVTDLRKVLDEVVITAEAPPVTLVGDTIQYNAGSFKTPPNSNVEQLLKRMPGLEVDKNGTITAQGQKVNRVLVDGKDFFGKDPKMATRNLPSDAIDKVQVFDKLSDAAQLTGFDDGNSEKTINLKLKEEKKKGAFGKLTAGAGTNDRYEGRLNVNSFKGARQLSVIGMGNNTNAEGFSFSDMLSFSGGLNKLLQGGGGSITLSSSDPMASALASSGTNNTGFRTIWGGGLNYNNIIGKKTQFTSNYFYNHYNPNSEKWVERQYFLPDSSYFYNQHSKSDNNTNSHRVNMSADIAIDSLHSIKISPSFGYQQAKVRSLSDYQTLSQEKQLTNAGSSNSYTENSGYNFDNEILFRKKFHRKGRTLSLTLQTSFNGSSGDGNLVSVTDFYQNGLKTTDSINQRNKTSADMRSYSAKAVYTEPLSRLSLLELSVGRSSSKSNSEKKTYDFDLSSGKFDDFNESLSNNFTNTYGYTNAGVRFRYQQRKYNIAIGINGQKAELEGKVISGTKDSLIGKTFYNLLPNARAQYSFNNYKKLTLVYSAYTTQPTVSQLQPVPDISNPISIREGNPDLKQEYSNTAQLSFTSVDPFRGKSLFINVTLQQTQNKIVSYDQIDEKGVRTTKPVNVDGVYSARAGFNLRLPLRFIKGNVSFNASSNYNRGKQFINTVANNISTITVGPSVRVSSFPTEKLELIVQGGLNYTRSAYSLQSSLNTKYVSQNYEAEINWQLPADFYLSTDLTYTVNNQLGSGFNARVPIWTASFSKQFLKYKRGEIKVSAFDLLNRNVGISRSSNQNYIEDSRVTNLQRFFMLSFTYSLSRFGKGGGVQMGGDRAVMLSN